ncbi:MAG TPA: serine/threonine-protein kinase [Polyangiaceae bacterium]|nr:serine/threonine-protein kinase [Polyangiaceae bacterium]
MAVPRKKPVSVGDVIDGKYRVERELGQGGVGIVVQARHLELHQPVAIKVLLLRDDPEQVSRFMHEARAAVRLRDEHVAKVSDVGRLPDGTPYMVMEFLEGENLSSVIERGPLSIEDGAGFVLQACEGIAEAHSLGIVHRDLKPANLFLTRTARGRPLVKVLDFGIAKRGASGDEGNDTRLTGAMTVMGSPPYMPPEQVRASRDVDFRSDIWSLGVTLYELVSGGLPFSAETVQDVCARVLTQPPTPLEHWLPAVPEDMRLLVLRCLEKDPAKRFQDIAQLASALEAFVPMSARSAERIRETLMTPPPSGWQPPGPLPTPVPPPGPPAPPVMAIPIVSTQTAFGPTASTPPRRKRFAMMGLAAGLGIAIAGGVVLLARSGGSESSAAPAASGAGATSEATTTAAAPRAASALAAETAPPLASLAPVPTAAPSTPPSPPSAAAAPPRPAAATPTAMPAPHRPRVKPMVHPESSQM